MENRCFIDGIPYKCRTCFDPGNSLYSLEDECSNSQTCREFLNEFAKLKTNNDELLPKTICCRCLKKLDSYLDFIHQIQNVNEKYNRLLRRKIEPLQDDNAECLGETPIDFPTYQNASEIKIEEELAVPSSITLNRNSELHSSNLDNKEDDYRLAQLLENFDLEVVLKYLKAAQVTYKSLQYMQESDIKEVIPPIGLRVEFREKLFEWKKVQVGINDDTLSVYSKASNYLGEKEDFNGIEVLQKSLISILNQTHSGRAILEHRNKNLSTNDRDSLIKLIVEEAVFKKILIRNSDFVLLMKEIVWIFPSEKNMQDYYFFEASKYKNPSGKLYSRYKNFRAKQTRNRNSSSPDEIEGDESISEVINQSTSQAIEIDETTAEALKSALKVEEDDWTDICEKWAQTFHIRHRDLLDLDSADFFQSWSKLSHSKAADLIEIDFNILYPGKQSMMFSKWTQFKNKVFTFYENHMTNEVCRQQLLQAKDCKNIDWQDFIISTLLNSVLQSSARFKNKDGKRTRKVTIADSQESFVLQLPTLKDYQHKIDEIVCKYYSAGLTVQPFLILHGYKEDVKGFYVYFNKNLLKFESFVQSFDICFKIFQIFSLQYPKACEQSWLFVQKYFFGIETEFDSKSANLASLMNYLQS